MEQKQFKNIEHFIGEGEKEGAILALAACLYDRKDIRFIVSKALEVSIQMEDEKNVVN